jgi:plastocyanin
LKTVVSAVSGTSCRPKESSQDLSYLKESKEIDMHKDLQRLHVALVIGMLCAVFLAACGGAVSNNPGHQKPSTQTASVLILKGQELFVPFVLTIQPHTTVVWQNNDAVSHTFLTTWDHSAFLNVEPFSLVVAPGQTTSFTFTKPGVYDYFDNVQARWDVTDHRVESNKRSPNFPLAMEGVIWVQGPIEGLAHSAKDIIPEGKDDFTSDFIATSRGGTVIWRNQDTDTHFISLVPGWSTPINPSTIGVIQIDGKDSAHPSGGTMSVTFSTPGLYYYYCSAHASINTTWHRAQAHQDASEFPIPMEGFILAVDS